MDSFENKLQIIEQHRRTKLIFEGMEIDVPKHLIYRNKRETKFTFIEFEILYLLARNPGRIFSKEQIYDIVWKEPYTVDYNIAMSHIRNIREKMNRVSLFIYRRFGELDIGLMRTCERVFMRRRSETTVMCTRFFF